MGKSVVLDKLVDAGNGYLTTAQVLESGISKPTLASYVKEQNLRRVGHGIYLADDAWEDNLYQLQLLNKKAIFSHETALFLHGLMEREPTRICVTVPAGYNATHLRKRGIQVTQEKQKPMGLAPVLCAPTLVTLSVPTIWIERSATLLRIRRAWMCRSFNMR